MDLEPNLALLPVSHPYHTCHSYSQVDGATVHTDMAGLAQEPGHFLSSDHLRRDIATLKWGLYFILCLRQDLCHNLELDNSPASDFMPHHALFLDGAFLPTLFPLRKTT